MNMLKHFHVTERVLRTFYDVYNVAEFWTET
jgi:hypothetical protein